MYGISLHKRWPKTKSLKSVPTKVNGMQSNPSSKSLMERFKRNRLVTVRIALFLARTIITRMLPPTPSRNIAEYNGICTLPFSQSQPQPDPELVKLPGIFIYFFNLTANNFKMQKSMIIYL